MSKLNPHYSGPVLSLHGVTKIYGRGPTAVKAVDNVDLEVVKGEVLLIMGPSGSGKTTLLTMAGALLRPTSGSISIMGADLAQLSDRAVSSLRLHSIGFVFQAFNLLSALTAAENVQVVMDLASPHWLRNRERARELLATLGMEHRAHHRPADLSGGEKQRVAIARALANDPPLVLADEPTASLDSRRGHEVMTLLREIAKAQERTVVIVSNDHRIRNVADRVLWLEDGRLREVRTVHDPVCGMALDEATAPIVLRQNGTTYFFCGPVCRDKFLAATPSVHEYSS